MNSEKVTDFDMLNRFKEVFGYVYNTKGNKELFGSKIPDGWFIFEFENKKDLMVIENKRNVSDKRKGLEQLKTYYSLIKNKKDYSNIYLVLGLGSDSDFGYTIYKIQDHKMKKTDLTFEDLDKPQKQPFNVKEIHEFNNIMWKNGIRPSRTEKILFVSAILLTLKVDSNFIKKFNAETEDSIIAKEMMKTLEGYYKDINFIKSFEFINSYCKSNIFYKLFESLDKDLRSFNRDILNLFYNEFLKYSFDDDWKIGIVLTPNDIVELMIKELNIKNGDSLLDCCTGTGSFLLKAQELYENVKLIGCEDNPTNYSLVKSNFILNNYDYTNLYCNSCFNVTFPLCDHIILNPPFSTNELTEDKTKKHNAERKFCLYQLKFLKEGRTGCWIIPRSNFNNSKQMFNRFKKEILENCQVLKLINCNPNLFGIKASSECAIIVFKKCKTKEKYETEIIDYSDDGYGYEDGIRIKKKEGTLRSYKEVLDYKDDWNYSSFKNQDYYSNVFGIFYNLKKSEYLKKIKEYEDREDYKKILEETLNYHAELKKLENIKVKEWKKIKVGEYFDIMKPLKTFEITKTENGETPLISSTKFNNGISKFINGYSFDLQEEYLTIAKNGSVGYCYIQKGKIGITTDVLILNLKEDKKKEIKDLFLMSLIFTDYFTKIYKYTNKLTRDKLIKSVLNYPIIEN